MNVQVQPHVTTTQAITRLSLLSILLLTDASRSGISAGE
jgi:hypothetical protein